jgi:hypothetical protein
MKSLWHASADIVEVELTDVKDVEAFDHGTVPGLWGLLDETMPVWASTRQATRLLAIAMNFAV